MSNLGLYQWFTTTAKKVGGPANLILLIGTGGYGVLRVAEACVKAGGKQITKLIKEHKKDESEEGSIYEVTTAANVEDGVDVQIGDKIKVCAIDNESAMIEILGAKNNPYFVGLDFLKSIVGYK